MKCSVCHKGETSPGTATITLVRGQMTLVVKGVPAQVCGNCGEEYVDEHITEQLLKTAEGATAVGVQVDVRDYVDAGLD